MRIYLATYITSHANDQQINNHTDSHLGPIGLGNFSLSGLTVKNNCTFTVVVVVHSLLLYIHCCCTFTVVVVVHSLLNISNNLNRLHHNKSI